MLEQVKKQVEEILSSDKSGHGMDHIERVYQLALDFAQKEQADSIKTGLIALLHDVDDYKIVGLEKAGTLSNARRILETCQIRADLAEEVLSELEKIGYSKSLQGVRPQSLEGKIVSDADMCDALGVHGVLRTFMYSIQTGFSFFDANTFPVEDMDYEQYTSHSAASSINHFFEKVLLLKDLMLTQSGRQEALRRHQIVVDLMFHYFEEENASEWIAYLHDFIRRHAK